MVLTRQSRQVSRDAVMDNEIDKHISIKVRCQGGGEVHVVLTCRGEVIS